MLVDWPDVQSRVKTSPASINVIAGALQFYSWNAKGAYPVGETYRAIDALSYSMSLAHQSNGELGLRKMLARRCRGRRLEACPVSKRSLSDK